MNQQATNLDPKNHQRIAAAIGFILDHYQDQPRLADIAKHVGLSSWHFNRLFRSWAGVTPKQLVQFLSLRAAKKSLDQHASILSASLNAGLSGPGRLHDLFVTIEAMTPGEYKNGGAGLVLDYGFSASPFGDVLLAGTRRGLSHLSFVDRGSDEAIAELSKAWPNATLERNEQGMSALAGQIFSGREKALQLRLKGTNFQLQVWQALLKIPSGNQTSYSELARTIGRPNSQRAVANAVGRNPVAWLIPCHRVLRASGALGGYRWGVDRKAEILTWELAQQV
ncbi:MAG: methylated-DNA--[protein]-cysteine S-methyltransferase [Gammaproteobacteria bacterium]|nr:methylated-DNA--[protein]-cysteine S-methyltransferase [Gammaproteobacteria bacterium]MCZ6687782.1 methylated-DNA--[protein]-cysteine S-methyltransferase [Gammaproteobacteria bacterium]